MRSFYSKNAFLSINFSARHFKSSLHAHEIIGLHLGTKYSHVAYVDKGNNARALPAVPTHDFTNKYSPEVYQSMLRLFGRRIDDPEVDRVRTVLSKDIVADADGFPRIEEKINSSVSVSVSPLQLTSSMIRHLKEVAEAHLGHKVAGTVLACPTNATDDYRLALKAAGRLAGIEVLRIINETTAAVISTDLFRCHEDQKIVVIHCDERLVRVAAAEISGGVLELFAVEDVYYGSSNDSTVVPVTFDKKLQEACDRCLKAAAVDSVADLKQIIVTGYAAALINSNLHTFVKEFFKREPMLLNASIIAEGAARQGIVISTPIKAMPLSAITPLSIGVASAGGVFIRIIDRCMLFPVAKRAVLFTTTVDNQSHVNIRVYQGEREMVADNKYMTQLDLPVAIAPKGVPKIEVTFEIDSYGILTIFATDMTSKTWVRQEIDYHGGLTFAVAEQMVDDAVRCKEADIARREEAERAILSGKGSDQSGWDVLAECPSFGDIYPRPPELLPSSYAMAR